MIKQKEMPEWYEKKCREYVQKTYPSLYKNTHPDCEEMSSFCFSILWPQIEVMKEALVGLAEQKVWNYDEGEEDFELNSSNFQLRIYLAQEALKKVEEITNE